MKSLIQLLFGKRKEPKGLEPEKPNYHAYDAEKEMIRRSMYLPESNWVYNGDLGLFLNKEDEDTRLALVFPLSRQTRYIYAAMESGKRIIAALPSEFHSQIVHDIKEFTGEDLHEITGGRIEVLTEPTSGSTQEISLYGKSGDYGQANHDEVAEILSRNGIGARFKKDNMNEELIRQEREKWTERNRLLAKLIDFETDKVLEERRTGRRGKGWEEINKSQEKAREEFDRAEEEMRAIIEGKRNEMEGYYPARNRDTK
jgi:hypothetical protein